MRSGVSGEPVEVLGTAGEGQVVQPHEIGPVGGRGEIEKPPLRLVASSRPACVQDGEHGTEPRVDFGRGAFDEDALALLWR